MCINNAYCLQGEPMKQENQVSQTELQIVNDMDILRKAVMVNGQK